jgi:hypothetical protein
VLSLLRQGYAWDGNPTVHSDQCNSLHVLDDALQELLGAQRTLCGIYEELVTMQAAVVPNWPNRESARQGIQPDLPFQDTLPLYVVFVALQNVTEDMGPTLYLMGTHQTMETATGSMGQLKQSGLVVSSHAHIYLCINWTMATMMQTTPMRPRRLIAYTLPCHHSGVQALSPWRQKSSL